MNESSFSTTLYSLQVQLPQILGPSLSSLLFSLALPLKIWHPFKSLRSGSLAKTNRSYLGPLIPTHLHSFPAKGQRLSELVAASQAQHLVALVYQCSVFLPQHASVNFSKIINGNLCNFQKSETNKSKSSAQSCDNKQTRTHTKLIKM